MAGLRSPRPRVDGISRARREAQTAMRGRTRRFISLAVTPAAKREAAAHLQACHEMGVTSGRLHACVRAEMSRPSQLRRTALGLTSAVGQLRWLGSPLCCFSREGQVHPPISTLGRDKNVMTVFDLGYSPSSHRSPRPGYDGTSLQDFMLEFPSDEACLQHLFFTRFGADPVCPRCHGTGRWQRHHIQKHYYHPCGGILSPMADVVFSRTRIPLQLWFYAMLHFANSAEGISTTSLARQIGISEQSAFRMSTRIRLHMAALDDRELVGGPGEMVMCRLVKVLRITNRRKNAQNSAMIFLLSDAKRVNATVIIRPRQKSLRRVISSKVVTGSIMGTDCYVTYRSLSNYNSGKAIAQFIPDYFNRDIVKPNLMHGFMQYFHLSFADQFRNVSVKNSWLYFKEYEFRYNRRHCSSRTFGELTSRFPHFDDGSIARLRARNIVGPDG